MANHAAVVAPSDTVGIPASTYLAFVNTGGAETLTITTVGGEKVVLTLPSGMWPIRATQVWQTGTSVTLIVAFWD